MPDEMCDEVATLAEIIDQQIEPPNPKPMEEPQCVTCSL
jgi:hypothetical protein